MEDAYFDITRKIQEFGFGPSDSESEEDDTDYEYGGSEWRQTLTSDWESIGLLPSLQKLQINFRNASYSFMTGLRRENPEQSQTSTNIEPITQLRNSDFGLFEDKNPKSQEFEVNKDEAETMGKEEHESNVQEEEEEDDEADEEDSADDENDDEWDEVGRLPKFNQLQLSLRNASSALNNQIEHLPSHSMAWQSFMPNFQLPSFFEEHENHEEELVDINDPKYADIFSEEKLTDEDRRIYYNEEGLTGCQHYLRNCKSECNECGKFYMCQLCHDEAESHHMVRELTRRMLCLNCKKPQPPRRTCRFCEEVMGDYYCNICKLWNDDPNKSIYHCDKCGICRVGHGLGIDVFHCDKCGICLSLAVLNNHRCIEQAAKSNCPICLEDLFSSTLPTVFMPCGHPIHRECFEEYSKRYYRCPVCAKSILNTSALFRMIDEEVQYEVLPPELADKVVFITCQDCHLKSQTKYHLAGLKCETCGSYNTAQL